MNVRVIIVDDEPLARQRVRSLLAEDAEIAVLAECGDGAAAVEAIERERPDLVFLDVQMPRLTGFEVLEAIEAEVLPAVIFTTAHDQHAIRAFEVSAVDYLLKPFKPARFQQALQRARAQLAARARPGTAPELASLLAAVRGGPGAVQRILVKSPDRILFVRPQEIDHIEAAGNYLILHVGKERHMIRDTMSAMEARLTEAGFMRLSRSCIVNLARIRELQPLAAGEYCVLLQSGARLNMTCRLQDLQARLAQA
jgi:two-component system LytT family response regulator